MNTKSKQHKTASRKPENVRHEESGCTDYLQHTWESCPENKAQGEPELPGKKPSNQCECGKWFMSQAQLSKHRAKGHPIHMTTGARSQETASQDKAQGKPELPKPVCPNCGQWQTTYANGYPDCMNECAKRGFTAKTPFPMQPQAQQPKHIYDQRCRSWDIEHGRKPQAQHSPLHLEQANGQTTIYDAKLNVLFRVEGRHFDALNPIVASVNHAEKLAEALRDLRTRVVAERPDCLNTTKADEALANWEGAK